jgi:methionine-rich copper-binding protein CopC
MHFVRKLRQQIALLWLSGLLALSLGCLGGGNGGGSPASISDREGVSVVVKTFLSAIRQKKTQELQSLFTPRMQILSGNGTLLQSLSFHDFGQDFVDPADDNAYTFYFQAEDVQVTGDFATVQAWTQMADGNVYTIKIELIRSDGVWYIDFLEILPGTTDAGIAGGLTGPTLWPLARGNSWRYAAAAVPNPDTAASTTGEFFSARITEPLARNRENVEAADLSSSWFSGAPWAGDPSILDTRLEFGKTPRGYDGVAAGYFPAFSLAASPGNLLEILGVRTAGNLSMTNQMGILSYGANRNFNQGTPLRITDLLIALDAETTQTVSFLKDGTTPTEVTIKSRVMDSSEFKLPWGTFNSVRLDFAVQFSSGSEGFYESWFLIPRLGLAAWASYDVSTRRVNKWYVLIGGVIDGTVYGADSGDAPQFMQIVSESPIAQGTVVQASSYSLSVTGGTPPLIWDLESAPAWVSISSTTGILTAFPPEVGTFTFEVSVQDANGFSTKAPFVLAVTASGTTEPLRVVSPYPASGARDVLLTTAIGATFNLPVSRQTVNSENIPIQKLGNVSVEDGTWVVSSDGKTASFTPKSGLDPSATYSVLISPQVLGTFGNKLATNVAWLFSTSAVPPVLTLLNPANNALQVPIHTTLIMTFNEPVLPGSGTFQLMKTSTNTLVKSASVPGDPGISFAGTQVAISFATPLEGSSTYYLLMMDHPIKNARGGFFGGFQTSSDWTFTTSESFPVLQAFSPHDEATGVASSTQLVLSFSKTVFAGSGDVSVRRLADDASVSIVAATDTTRVSFNNATVTISLPAPLGTQTAYSVNIASTAFIDASGNRFAGISDKTTWNFETSDETAPQISSVFPLDNAVGVASNAILTMTFSEGVFAGPGAISIRRSGDNSTLEVIAATDSTRVSISGTVVTVHPTAFLESLTDYYVQVASTCFRDPAGNYFPGISSSTVWNFRSGDFTRPVLMSFSPADETTGVDQNTDLTLTFSENVFPGTGGLSICRSSDDTVFEAIPASDTARVVISGAQATINPNGILESAASYYVRMDANAFKDASENFFLGIADKTTWNLQVRDYLGPQVLSFSPANGATGVLVSGNLVVTFNETILTNTGNIYLKRISDDSIARTFDVTGASVVISGSTAVITYSNLSTLTGFYLNIGNTCFKDSSGNTYSGIADKTTWGFTTSVSS